jgi:hypothetical protein
VAGAFTHWRNFSSWLAEITRARPAMGRGIDTHGLRADRILAVDSPDSHDAACAALHPSFGSTTPGTLGLHASFNEKSPAGEVRKALIGD